MKLKTAWKRVAVMAATVLMAATVTVTPVFAETLPSYVASGTCGDAMEWTLDDSGNLKVYGTGDMWGYDYSRVPWIDYKAQIKSITVGSGVTTIGSSAFQDCPNLTTVKLPATVKDISANAFKNNANLTTINFPKSLKSIGIWAFQNCSSLSTVELPEGFTTFYGGGSCSAFENTGVEKLVLPSTLERDNGCTFRNCDKLTEVTVKGPVVGGRMFEDCDNLKTVTISDKTKNIDDWAFYKCKNLETVDFGKNVERIGGGAFFDCDSLTEIEIPDSATEFKQNFWGEGAFQNCDKLETVTVGRSVSYMNRTFRDCPSLKTVYFCGDAPTFEQGYQQEPFTGCGDLTAYVPANAVDTTWTPSVRNPQGAKSIVWKTWNVPVSHFAVQGEYAKNGTEKVSVKWKPMDGAAYYEIYRKAGTEPEYKKMGTTNKTSFTDYYAKSNGVKYAYKIRARSEDNVKSQYCPAMVTYYVARPTVSKVTQRGGGKLTVYYGRNTSANGYQVQFSTSSKFTSPTTVTIRSGKTTSATKTLKKGKKYYIRARSFKTVSGKNYFSTWKNYSKTVVAK